MLFVWTALGLLQLCFCRIVLEFVGLFEHCRKAAKNCKRLSNLVKGHNTNREVVILRII